MICEVFNVTEETEHWIEADFQRNVRLFFIENSLRKAMFLD